MEGSGVMDLRPSGPMLGNARTRPISAEHLHGANGGRAHALMIGALLVACLLPIGNRAWAEGAHVRVTDFLLLANEGTSDATEFTFRRCCPVIDDRQAVIREFTSARLKSTGETLGVEKIDYQVDHLGNGVGTWRVDVVPAGQQVLVELTWDVLVRREGEPLRAVPIVPAEELPSEVRPFLEPTANCDSRDPVVMSAAQEAVGTTRNAIAIIRRIARFMRSLSGQALDQSHKTGMAATVLKSGGHSCIGSSAAAVALLRACGLPARIVYCMPAAPQGSAYYTHGIAQAWIDGRGWVPFEPISGGAQFPLPGPPEKEYVFYRFGTRQDEEYVLPEERGGVVVLWPLHAQSGEQFFSWHGDGAKVVFAHPLPQEGYLLGAVPEPFYHYEPGNYGRLLGPAEVRCTWESLIGLSREYMRSGSFVVREKMMLASLMLPASTVVSKSTVARQPAADEAATQPLPPIPAQGPDELKLTRGRHEFVLNPNNGLNTTVLSSLPDCNFAHLHSMGVEDTGTRALLRFNLARVSRDQDVELVKAALRLYRQKAHPCPDDEERRIGFHLLLEPWKAVTTWNKMPDLEKAPFATIAYRAETGWLEVDVTAQVKRWLANPETNYGIMVKFTEEGREHYVFWEFSGATTQDATRRPEIVFQCE